MARQQKVELFQPFLLADMRQVQRHEANGPAGVRIMHSSAAFCVFSGLATRRIGNRCSRDQAIGRRDRIIVRTVCGG